MNGRKYPRVRTDNNKNKVSSRPGRGRLTLAARPARCQRQLHAQTHSSGSRPAAGSRHVAGPLPACASPISQERRPEPATGGSGAHTLRTMPAAPCLPSGARPRGAGGTAHGLQRRDEQDTWRTCPSKCKTSPRNAKSRSQSQNMPVGYTCPLATETPTKSPRGVCGVSAHGLYASQISAQKPALI